MENVVVYQSNTGFTKQYAQLISRKLNCNCFDIKQTDFKYLENKNVIYGGWVLGNGIIGLDKIQKINCNLQCVFAVGASEISDAIIKQIKDQNKLENIKFFYMQGGFRYDKLGFIHKTMLKTVKKMISKKADKTPQDLFMEKTLGTSFTAFNENNVEEMVSFLNSNFDKNENVKIIL